jgi:ABC-type uncharacterized transport system ATPase subunit
LVRKTIQDGGKKIQELSKEITGSCSLCIAQAKLLIFDEPFSGFDPTIKDEIGFTRRRSDYNFLTHGKRRRIV